MTIIVSLEPAELELREDIAQSIICSQVTENVIINLQKSEMIMFRIAVTIYAMLGMALAVHLLKHITQ